MFNVPKTFSSVPIIPIKRILYVLRRDLYFKQKEEVSLLISLSGGQDSTCLVFFIIMYQKLFGNEKEIRIGILHCQHNWNLDSLDRGNFIDSWLNLLKRLQVNFEIYSSIPVTPTVSEGDGRKWRLRLLNRIAKKYKYDFVLTGHTLNDEVETFLIQTFIRGFIKNDLNKPLSNKKYLQPLTWTHRKEILDICTYWQFPLFADSTNQEILLPRSRIRLELLSILKAFYNPQIENSLKQIIELEKENNNTYNIGLSIHFLCNNNQIILNRSKLNQLPLVRQKLLWRQSFGALGVFNVGFYWIEKCLFYSQTKKEFIFYFIKNIKLKGSAKWLILSKNQN